MQLLLGAVVAGAVVELTFLFYKAPADGGEFDVEGGFGTLEDPRFEITYAGLAPRRALRLAPAEGKRDFRLVLWSESEGMGIEARTQVELGVRATVADVQPDGSFRYGWKIRSADVVEASASGDLIEPEQAGLLAGLKGLKGVSVLDDRGYVLRSTLLGGGTDAPAELRHGIAQGLQEPTLHLPEAPVGEKAVWKLHRFDVRDGVEVRSTDRYEITDLDDDAVTVTIRTTETAARQRLDEVRMMNLMTITSTLKRLDGTGGGTWTFGLTDQLPTTGEGWLDRTTQMIVSLSGLEQDVELAVRSETAIE